MRKMPASSLFRNVFSSVSSAERAIAGRAVRHSSGAPSRETASHSPTEGSVENPPLMVPSKDRVEQSAKPRSPLTLLSFQDLAKASTVLGAGAYGILFLAYQAFYGQIGIRPEDVGVTYSYVLARSIGFVAVVAVLFVFTLGTYAYASLIGDKKSADATSDSVRRDKPNRIEYVFYSAGLLAGSFLVWFGWAKFYDAVSLFEYMWYPTQALLGILIVLHAALRLVAFGNPDRRIRLIALVGLPAVILGVAIGTIRYGDALGRQAASGVAVSPVTIRGLPFLDVEARPAAIEWVGPPGQRPGGWPPSGRRCVLALGQNSSTFFAITSGGKLLRTPLLMVSVDVGDAVQCGP